MEPESLPCSLTGRWVNEKGSKIAIFRSNNAGVFRGFYLTAVAATDNTIRPSLLQGIQHPEHQSTFGFVVKWNFSASTAVFVGQCFLDENGEEQLKTAWLLRAEVGSVAEDWKATSKRKACSSAAPHQRGHLLGHLDGAASREAPKGEPGLGHDGHGRVLLRLRGPCAQRVPAAAVSADQLLPEINPCSGSLNGAHLLIWAPSFPQSERASELVSAGLGGQRSERAKLQGELQETAKAIRPPPFLGPFWRNGKAPPPDPRSSPGGPLKGGGGGLTWSEIAERSSPILRQFSPETEKYVPAANQEKPEDPQDGFRGLPPSRLPPPHAAEVLLSDFPETSDPSGGHPASREGVGGWRRRQLGVGGADASGAL
ncbi:avidin-like [Crotalus adamanteus]|uniref:Avidin-like n=1 Tax=Crotalus adamanteus TaxID=8729 RepID=A0AAW1C4M3_CROAD